MKKLNLTMLTLTSAFCMMAGAFFMADVDVAKAENAAGTTPTFSTTKVMLSKSEDKMMLVTAIKDMADVYEVGYTFEGTVVTKSDETTKYYTSIGDGTTTLTADDIFEETWVSEEGVGMIIWEVEFGFDTAYEYKPYAKVGERAEGGELVLPSTENVKTAEAIEKTFYKATFKVEEETVATKVYTDATSVVAPEIPFKPGYVGAWSATAGNASATITAEYTAVDATQFTAVPVANTDIQLRNAAETVSVALPVEFEGYTAVWAKQGEKAVGATMDGANVALTVANLTRGEGKVTLLAYKGTEYKVAEMAVTVADVVIKDSATLNLFYQDLVNAKTDGSHGPNYYVLAGNVDFGGERWLPGFSNSPKNFWGILDGRGYTLANYYSQYGLCKEIKPGAQIKNIHLKPIIRTNTSKVAGVGLINFGTVENCFVDIKITDAERTIQVGGVVANNEKGTIKNCIVTISSFTSTTDAKWIGDVNMSAIALTKAIAGSGSESNCYAINKIAAEQYLHVNDMYGDGTTAGLYTEVAKFFEDVTALDKANGWGSFWKLEGGKLYFKDVQVL